MSSTKQTTRKPLTSFTLFPELLPEIRIKIWGIHMSQPRIIELEYRITSRSPEFSAMSRRQHKYFGVARYSLRILAIFLVNQEANHEARKIYKLLRFDYDLTPILCRQRPVYFNPASDIVYFGEHACIRTIAGFSRLLGEKNVIVPNIGVRVAGGKEVPFRNDSDLCVCRWRMDSRLYIRKSRGSDEGHELLRILHGIDPAQLGDDKLIPGFAGLKNVYFVMPSHHETREHGEEGADLEICEAACDGLVFPSFEQTVMRGRIEDQIGILENDGNLDRVGDNRWIGQARPEFQFISLAPLSTANTDDDYSMTALTRGVQELEYHGDKI